MNAKPHILIVDDDPSVTVSLSLLLKKSGFTTATSANPEEALRLVAELFLIKHTDSNCRQWDIVERNGTYPKYGWRLDLNEIYRNILYYLKFNQLFQMP